MVYAAEVEVLVVWAGVSEDSDPADPRIGSEALSVNIRIIIVLTGSVLCRGSILKIVPVKVTWRGL